LDPALCSGPPSGPPFQSGGHANARLSLNTAVSQSGMGPVPAPYIAPSPLLNFPPGVQQFGPSVTMVSVASEPVPPVFADPILLAAAAGAAHGHDSLAEVRGGVTYFNPTAQNFLPQRPVIHKRPKAAIAIVDPSNMPRGDSMPKDGFSPSFDSDHGSNSSLPQDTSDSSVQVAVEN